jgi:hypothetical protein
MTFPAVTVNFYLPEKMDMDPFEYFDTLFEWKFYENYYTNERSIAGVACDLV